jgi:hypothetical protein
MNGKLTVAVEVSHVYMFPEKVALCFKNKLK